MTGDHFDTESLEAFERDLGEAGFEPVSIAGFAGWRAPIRQSFSGLTDATTMDVVIRPGWPFRSPALFADGLDTNHSTPEGFVCLWQDGDPSGDWITVEGFFGRVDEWCDNARRGWPGDELQGDAFLNFRIKSGFPFPYVATVDLSEFNVRSGSWGEFRGTVNTNPPRLDIHVGRPDQGHPLRGLWFHAGELDIPPPRSLAEVFRCLSRSQRKGLNRALADRGRPDPFVASGGVDLILFCWERNSRRDFLVMACAGMNSKVDAAALRPGPTDEMSLILRAGPDAPTLRTLRVTLFGAGALGGHVGTTLSESGIGFLDIVDADVLLPENVVRHVAGHDQVGALKVRAVHLVIDKHAPWTEVSEVPEAPATPARIRELISNSDMVIDTTGNDAFVPALAMVAEELGKPLVSGALYRGGKIARVQRQVLAEDSPIHRREEGARYPSIPSDGEDNDFVAPALGCSAPVNNAPPASVLGCAALIVQVAIDALAGRFELNDEVTDVYRPIGAPPFDRNGRVGID